jgi:hypothetical protein
MTATTSLARDSSSAGVLSGRGVAQATTLQQAAKRLTERQILAMIGVMQPIGTDGRHNRYRPSIFMWRLLRELADQTVQVIRMFR